MADQELADQTLEIDTGVVQAEIPSEQPLVETTDKEPKEAKKPTLRETLNASVEEVRKAERARDERGKFAPEPKKQPEKIAADKTEIPKTEQNVQPAASKPAGPPSGLSKETVTAWNTLPEHVKSDFTRRSAEFDKGITEYRQKTAQLQEISQALEPLRPVLQQQGIQTEAQAVKRLLEWEASIRNPQTRIHAIRSLAGQYGVDLSQLVQSSSEPSTAQDIPANLRPVIDQFGNIVQKVNTLESELQRRDQERVSSELSAFAKDKPHFEKVRATMGKLMMSGLATDLEGAYQQAIALDREVSAQIAAEKEATRLAEQQKQQAEKARQARQAAISPSVRAPSGPVANGAKVKPGVRGSILESIERLRTEQRA